MRDADVRAAVRASLAIQYASDADTRIVEEMGVWSGSVRIDIAVINGELHGYELKSARDTLKRLPLQAEIYNQVFDRVTLVAATCHVDHARREIPRWWGITTAFIGCNGSLQLRVVRETKQNTSLDPLQVARLLWKEEALLILKERGLDKGVRSKPVDSIANRLAEALALSDLCQAVRRTLKERSGWLGEPVGNKRDMTVHTD